MRVKILCEFGPLAIDNFMRSSVSWIVMCGAIKNYVYATGVLTDDVPSKLRPGGRNRMVAERVIPSTGAHPGLRTPHSARPDPGIVTPRSPGSVITDSGVQD